MAELRWFRTKREAALARTMVLTGGMSAFYYAGSLLSDGRHAGDAYSLVQLGILVRVQAGIVIRTLSSGDLATEVLAKRAAMQNDQRKRIFLAALDDDAPPA